MDDDGRELLGYLKGIWLRIRFGLLVMLVITVLMNLLWIAIYYLRF